MIRVGPYGECPSRNRPLLIIDGVPTLYRSFTMIPDETPALPYSVGMSLSEVKYTSIAMLRNGRVIETRKTVSVTMRDSGRMVYHMTTSDTKTEKQ